MKLTTKGEYATRALLDLSLRKSGEIVKIQEISAKEHIPIRYLETIMLELKKACIVSSKTGANGGFYLAKSPEKITLGEVIRVVEGPIAPISCVSISAYKKCPEENNCGLRSVWMDVRNSISEILDKITFADVCKRTVGMLEKRTNYSMYNI